MLFSISSRDVARLMGLILVVVLLMAFGQAILIMLGIAAFGALFYWVNKAYTSVQMGKMLKREEQVRAEEKTQKCSPLAFSGKVMSKVVELIRAQTDGDTSVNNMESNVDNGLCFEAYRVDLTQDADAEDQTSKFQVVFAMDARKPHGADLQLWELDVWPEPIRPIWLDRQASIDLAAGKIATAIVAQLRSRINETA